MTHSQDTPLRIGILGASSIAPTAVVEPARRRAGVEVASVAARRPGAAQWFAEQWGVPRAETSYEALLQDPAIDIVYVSLAASDHAEWAIAALDAGKDVLCEKPAAVTLPEARAMAAAGERSGRLLLEGFHYRWHPLFLTLRQSADEGRIARMSSTIVGSRPFVPGSVLHDSALGGGVLRHSGCYAVHWMRLLTGEEPRVAGFGQQRGPAGADASSVLDLVFPSGITGRITSSFDRARGTDDPPELVIESEASRIDADGVIAPQDGHSVRVHPEGGAVRRFTVGGAASFDYQLDALIGALDDRAAAHAFRQDLVAQAVVLDAAYGSRS